MSNLGYDELLDDFGNDNPPDLARPDFDHNLVEAVDGDPDAAHAWADADDEYEEEYLDDRD